MTDTIDMVEQPDREPTSVARHFHPDYWHPASSVSEHTSRKHAAMLQAVFAQPLRRRTIVEIGVGAQGGAISLLQRDNRVRGFDASPGAVASCRRQGMDVTELAVDREPLPLGTDVADVMFAFEVLEHLANPQFALEEIRRVLRPDGVLVVTTPNPVIHRWPRFFYPSLVEREAFCEFLTVNRFHVRQEIHVGAHQYAKQLPERRDQAWSGLWVCQNLKHGPAALLLENALKLWEQVDQHGIRRRPLETADLLHACLLCDPDCVDAQFLLPVVLTYRAINGETAEFEERLSVVMAHACDTSSPHTVLAMHYLCQAYNEMQKFSVQVVPGETFDKLVHVIALSRPDLSTQCLEETSGRST